MSPTILRSIVTIILSAVAGFAISDTIDSHAKLKAMEQRLRAVENRVNIETPQ